MAFVSNNIDIDVISKNSVPIMSISLPKESDINMYKYEIYGNKNFYLFGSMDLKIATSLNISLEIPEDNIFFIKIVSFDKFKKISNIYFKFYNQINCINGDRNMRMNIMKKEKINKNKILEKNFSDSESNNEDSDSNTNDQSNEDNE